MSGLRIAIAGLVALAVAMGIGRFAFTPILPMMQEDAGVSVAAGGWLASANYLGYLVGSLWAMLVPAGSAIAIPGGLLAIAIATLGMGLADSFPAWLVLRFMAGVASAWVLITVASWCLAELVARNEQRLFGLVFGGVGTGIAAVGVLCVALMRGGASSSHAWIAAGIVALAASASVVSTLRGGTAASGGARPPAPTAMRLNGEQVRLVLCYGAAGFGYIIPATFLPVMAKQLLGDPALFGWSWPVFGAAALVSVLAVAARPARISNRAIWAGSYLVMAAGIVLPLAVPGLAAIMLAALLVGGTFVVITMVAMQEARAVAGGSGAGLMAAMTASFALTQALGPLAVTWSANAGRGFGGPLFAAALLLAVSAWALRPARAREALAINDGKDAR